MRHAAFCILHMCMHYRHEPLVSFVIGPTTPLSVQTRQSTHPWWPGRVDPDGGELFFQVDNRLVLPSLLLHSAKGHRAGCGARLA